MEFWFRLPLKCNDTKFVSKIEKILQIILINDLKLFFNLLILSYIVITCNSLKVMYDICV